MPYHSITPLVPCSIVQGTGVQHVHDSVGGIPVSALWPQPESVTIARSWSYPPVSQGADVIFDVLSTQIASWSWDVRYVTRQPIGMIDLDSGTWRTSFLREFDEFLFRMTRGLMKRGAESSSV